MNNYKKFILSFKEGEIDKLYKFAEHHLGAIHVSFIRKSLSKEIYSFEITTTEEIFLMLKLTVNYQRSSKCS